MKGAKRILSVFLLLLMLCTFFVFPADAVGEGTIPNFSNPAWKFVSFSVGSNGLYAFSTSADGMAYIPLDLTPGERYKFSGTAYFSGSVTAPTYRCYIVFVTDTTDASVTIFETNSKGSLKFDKEFVVPDRVQYANLVFSFAKAYSTIDYSSGWKIENTSTDKGILNSIKEGFSKLWDWLQKVWDSIKEIPAKVGQFITNLGDRISTFFSNLTNSIKGFFTDLWDKIWNGDGSVPPFDNNNKFAQVIEKLNEWTAKIKDFSGSVDSSADTVTGYIRSGTTFLNSAMGAFPAALTAVLGFALVFIVVRKVVGR